MKKLIVLLIFLVAASGARGQSTTTFTITVVAPPSCTVTLAPNPVSTSGSQLYSGQAGVINFNISQCTIASSTATATWDTVSTPTKFTAGPPAALSVPISATQATVGTHSLVLTIPLPILSFNTPWQLPNGSVGTSYTVDLASAVSLSKDNSPCTSCSFTSTNLPSGFALSSSGSLTGTPSGTGDLTFDFTVTDNSPLVGAIHFLHFPIV